MFVKVSGRRRGPEPVNSDPQAVEARVALPAIGRAGLDRHPQYLAVRDVGQDVVAISFILGVEALGARHRHHVGADPLAFEPLGDGERDLDFRAGRDEDDLARRSRALQRVGAPCAQILLGSLGSHGLEVLPCKRQHARPVVGQRRRPALGGLHRIGRAEDFQLGHRPQALEMLDRLVRRPVLAEPDRIMGHDVDDLGLLQRRQADGGPAIIGEDQEGAAVGDHPPVQRHAVHRRRHAELADSVIDVAAGVIVGGQRLLALGPGVV